MEEEPGEQGWEQFVRGVKPLASGARDRVPEEAGRRERIIMEAEFQPAGGRSPVDRGFERRIRRGRCKPEGRLDLHGYGLEEARRVLARFVEVSSRSGKGCILVITGKGDRGRGVLREALPEMLKEAEIACYVGGYACAHINDGGVGASYLFLRKRVSGRG